MRAQQTCSYPGCPTLVKRGRCSAHTKEQALTHHDPAVQRLYKSKRWLQIRARQLARDPWCAECLRTNSYVPATDVDHIEPHRGDQAKFFHGPFQSLCHACHSRKTAGETWGVGGDKSPERGENGAHGAADFSLYGFDA